MEPKMREIRISIPEEFFSIFPAGKAFDHLLNAKKELLLALRSLIDARIEVLEKKGKKEPARKKKIRVE